MAAKQNKLILDFSSAYRQDIESGEYQVVTRDKRRAEIIHWDVDDDHSIVAVVNGKAHIYNVDGSIKYGEENLLDLCIIAPSPLTDFEKAVGRLSTMQRTEKTFNAELAMFPSKVKKIQEDAQRLLILAKEELDKRGELTQWQPKDESIQALRNVIDFFERGPKRLGIGSDGTIESLKQLADELDNVRKEEKLTKCEKGKENTI